MYMIVVGAGRIGSSFVELATLDSHDVVVIDSDPEIADEIASTYDCLVLNGDGTDRELLEEAGIERADAVVSTTSDDAVNTMLMLLAQEYDVPTLVSAVRDADHLPVFEKIGVTVVENPQELVADSLYYSVQYPGVEDFMRMTDDAEMVELEVEADAPVTDRSLSTAVEDGLIPSGARVAAVLRDSAVITPTGETTLSAGDVVTVLVNEATMDEALGAFGHETNGA